MAKYTRDTLASEDFHFPYKKLVERNENGLREHQEILQALTPAEKVRLITLLIEQWPEQQLATRQQYFPAAASSTPDRNDFFVLLEQAFGVYESLHHLADINNAEAHAVFYSPAFNTGPYYQFKELKTNLVNACDRAMASNLVIHAPSGPGGLPARTRAAFRGTGLEEHLNKASILDDLLIMLCSDKPHNMFKSRDYNIALFLEYPELVNARLKGKEQQIAEKLIASDCWHFLDPFLENNSKINSIEAIYAHIYPMPSLEVLDGLSIEFPLTVDNFLVGTDCIWDLDHDSRYCDTIASPPRHYSSSSARSSVLFFSGFSCDPGSPGNSHSDDSKNSVSDSEVGTCTSDESNSRDFDSNNDSGSDSSRSDYSPR